VRANKPIEKVEDVVSITLVSPILLLHAKRCKITSRLQFGKGNVPLGHFYKYFGD
jgi:hypothetical protein